MPSGTRARIDANLAVIDTLARLDTENRPATGTEQEVLARWSGWGATPEVFDERIDTYQTQRDYLKEHLTTDQYRSASASTLNAHYTDPAIAAAMWQALTDAGFAGDRVLEPGCGSGNFIGLAPAGAEMVGVESDPITAAVAARLYPSAQVRLEGFETTRLPESTFAAVVGNVPFGDFRVADPIYNPQGFSIHNHFIIKSLRLTAPGGYALLLTSRYTMDAIDPKARTALSKVADLIGAVRLPTKAFARVAGTDVITDILVLRRREPGRTLNPNHTDWLTSGPINDLTTADGTTATDISINHYFHQHPHNILGTLTAGSGQFGAQTLRVEADTLTNLADTVTQRLTRIINDAAQDSDRSFTALPGTLIDPGEISFAGGLVTAATEAQRPRLHSLRYDTTSQSLQNWTGHQWSTVNAPKTRLAETRELLAIRDAAEALIGSQRDQAAVGDRERLRTHLNRLYDTYVTKHGPIGRFKWTTPQPISLEKHDKRVEKAEEAWRKAAGDYDGPVPADLLAEWDEQAWAESTPSKRSAHIIAALRADPGWGQLSSLEAIDNDTGEVRKAPIFTIDVLGPAAVVEHCDTIDEALAVCLGERNQVDVTRIAELLHQDQETTRDQLNGLVFPSLNDPSELIPATTALSGNVRDKLARATDAVTDNPIYRDYASALAAVLPEDRTASQITARLGASWIGVEHHIAFVREVLGAQRITADHVGGTWTFECPRWERESVAMTETFGTPAKDAIELLDAVCNSKTIIVRAPAEEDASGPPPIDGDATIAAQAKAARLDERFKAWVFENEQRRDTLVSEYNRRFNSIVPPRYNGAGLTFPGKSERFVPHSYQRDAVARILAEPTVLLDHVVGAGKTGTMFMAAMELRRLGLARQPWIVVPNHIIEQVGAEAKWWYPGARVLIGDASTDREARNRLIAQSAADDWDMVIMAESQFGLIGVSPATHRRYIDDEIAEMRAALTAPGAEFSKPTQKRIEKQVKKLQDKLDALTKQDAKDQSLTFEQSGADYLFIDEAHRYKNLRRTTHIEELAHTGVGKAEGLAMKLRLLRERREDEAQATGHGETVARVATFATGTPVANSLGELYVMQKYLRPDLLDHAGVGHINDWARTFTANKQVVEVPPSGIGLRTRNLLAKFGNVAELMQLTRMFSDVVQRQAVEASGAVQLPSIAGGKRRIITVTPSQEVKDFVADLGHRAGALKTHGDGAKIDNILKISTDGRNVSLDPRLANMGAPAPGTARAAVVADEIMRIHHATADNTYTDAQTGATMARRGGLQIVFCDRGTPSADPGVFTIYGAIRDELVQRGMPPEAIRFIHDAIRPTDRQALFAACNTGNVSVLLGSTEKMGTGTNVQTRATALHHVDVPWRPADLEQREGRVIRQGNQNATVEICNYVTEGTYDTVMWQKVEAKAAYIEQLKVADLAAMAAGEVDDIGGGEMTIAAAETKALATGDPRYVTQVQLQDDVARLTALHRAHSEAGERRDRERTRAATELAHTRTALDTLTAVLDQITARAEAPTAYDIGGQSFAERKDAAGPFADACQRTFHALRNAAAWETRPLGVSINGYDMMARREHLKGELVIAFDIPSAGLRIPQADIAAATTATLDDTSSAKARGLLQRAENVFKDIPHHHQWLTTEHARLAATVDDLTTTVAAPFESQNELDAKRDELSRLTTVLRLEAESDAAQALQAAAEERMAAAGRKPGWSLELNPSEHTVTQSKHHDAATYRAAYLRACEHRAAEHRAEQQRAADKDRDLDDGMSL
ncbi:helicase-related protein [Mycolicibacter acidiphilus]|uniref:helicase-related protein n=1 Tax=Mycolicibacter acidiphilus TaxID=2835306 RepID=UPI0027DE229E|nr:helicase-related protein [Mycolicibacter acidiphilus]